MACHVRLADEAFEAHMDGMEFDRKDVAMSTLSINSILARIADAMAKLTRERDIIYANALAIRHIEVMPDYLRRDIGVPEGADIAAVIERGTARGEDNGIRRVTAARPCTA